MDQAMMEACLQDLHLPAVRYFQTIDSTNVEAWRWLDSSPLSPALIVSDEQTAGRGRLSRRWVTASGSGLAFSLLLCPPDIDAGSVSRLVGLAAVAVCESLQACFSLHPQIKWPNDVLLNRRKTAGILVESRWNGDLLTAVVVGIGINIAPDSVDPRHFQDSGLNFPATCVEECVGHPVDRWELLHAVLEAFLKQLPGITQPMLIDKWQKWLAYRGEWVTLVADQPGRSSAAIALPESGKLVGLADDGSLVLSTPDGNMVTIPAGEIQLRPAGSPIKMEKDWHV